MFTHKSVKWGLPWWLSDEESTCNSGDQGSIPSSGRSPGQPTPAFLPGESHGQRSLAGYSQWGHKDLDTTELPTLSLHFQSVKYLIMFIPLDTR